MNAYLRILDWLTEHKAWCWTLFALILLLLAGAASRLRFKEDITDFLPMTEEQKNNMFIYEQLSESDKIVVLFSCKDSTENNPDRLCDAIDAYTNHIEQDIQTQIDMDDYFDNIIDIYRHIPYYLSEYDYERIDSLLTEENIALQLEKRKNQLLSPISSVITKTMVYDPLELFPINQIAPQHHSEQFTSYDGYMMSADCKMAFAFVKSPYGQAETGRNAMLVDSLQYAITMVTEDYPDVNIRLIGAPPVAVNNARQIKRDSFIAIAIALLLIVIILFCSIHDWRSIVLILVATGFGLLFAMGMMGLIHPQMSLIVLGIASVIIGIAVNYPLHILVHSQYTSTIRETMVEEFTPLLIGNITTIGAFLTLVPLNSIALRDLGIFCAAMLIGTIVFSLFFLPQFRFSTPNFRTFSPISKGLDRLATIRPEKNKVLLVLLLVCTVICAWFCRKPAFDANLSHINYLTEQQKSDFATLAALAGQDADEVEMYIPCEENTDVRAQRWNDFWASRKEQTVQRIEQQALNFGFKQSAFAPFENIISQPLTSRLSTGEEGLKEERLLQPLTTPPAQAKLTRREFIQRDEVSTYLEEHPNAFFVEDLQMQITKSLSDNFNYIGLACSLIVFVFLWISFKRFLLAFIAFVPMLLSWVWILGIMNIAGIQFNIVNIILATFIFGQGDDYTIFITQGLLMERKSGGQMLSQYKNEILLSAIVMFIGIGVLIFAKHPALFSLGALVLIGMSSVVLMAILIPPLLFQFFNKFIK